MRLTSLKLCRFERGVMQNVLARRADIAWGRLSAIENGDAEALPDELQRIAAALQVPIDALSATPAQMMKGGPSPAAAGNGPSLLLRKRGLELRRLVGIDRGERERALEARRVVAA